MSEVYNNKGSVFVFLAFALMALLGITALVIDGYLMVTGYVDYAKRSEEAARMALLTRLNGSSFSDAEKAAEQALKDNPPLVKSFLKLSESEELYTEYPPTVKDKHGEISWAEWRGVAGSGACLEASVSDCPCKGGNWNTPCAKPVDHLAAGVNPTAVTVNVRTRSANPILPLFAGVMGFNELSAAARTTVVARPLRLVLLMDMSGSMANRNHLSYEQLTKTTRGKARKYTFRLNTKICSGKTNPCLNPVPVCDMEDDALPLLNRAIYNRIIKWPFFKTRPAAPQDVWKAYRDDYRCFAVTYKHGSGSSVTKNLLVDTYHYTPAVADQYTKYGAEPLATMLKGAEELLEAAKDNYPGDVKVAFVAFDSRADMDIRTMDFTTIGTGDAAKLANAAITHNPTTANKDSRIEDFGLFVRDEAHSNITAALKAANDLIQADSQSEIANKVVVLLSDGMSTCDKDGCALTETKAKAAIKEAVDYALDNYVAEDIRLSVIMDSPAAHILVAPSHKVGTRCMDTDEAAKLDPPALIVDDSTGSGTFADMIGKIDPVTPWYEPVKLFTAVQKTGGIWVPLLDPCTDAGGTIKNYESDMHTKCDDGTAGYQSGSDMPKFVTDTSKYTDSNGRLTCAVDEQNKRAQLEKAAEKIISQQSYYFVSRSDEQDIKEVH